MFEETQAIQKIRRFKRAQIIITESRKYAIGLVVYPEDSVTKKLEAFEAANKAKCFFAVLSLCKITSHKNTIFIEGQINDLKEIVKMMYKSFNPEFISKKQKDRLNDQLIEALNTPPKPTEQNKEHLKATRQNNAEQNNSPKPNAPLEKAPHNNTAPKEHRKPIALTAISSSSSSLSAFFAASIQRNGTGTSQGTTKLSPTTWF